MVNFSLSYFVPDGGQIGIQFGKALEVFAIVLLPVLLGMLVRRWRPTFRGLDGSAGPNRLAGRPGRGHRRGDHHQPRDPAEYFGTLSLITIVFCLLSLTVGYVVPLLLRVGRPQAIATSFEIGIHNATLAIVIAQSVLGSVEMSLPAGVYGVLMFFIAAAFGFVIRDRRSATRPSQSAPGVGSTP